LLATTSGTDTLETTASTALVHSTTLATTATENRATATTESALLGAGVVNDGEGGLVLGGSNTEQVGGTGTVGLLVYSTS
jgi:hypothetical protein